MMLMRKGVVFGISAAGAALLAGAAFAVVSGFVVTPDIDTGSVSGSGGSNSCQAGSGVTFTVPNPTWSDTLGDYAVSTINYSGITSTCTGLGTADLTLNITIPPATSSIANATASNISSATGSLTLSTPITYSDAANGDYNFIVKDN